jgi:hypothetical protein
MIMSAPLWSGMAGACALRRTHRSDPQVQPDDTRNAEAFARADPPAGTVPDGRTRMASRPGRRAAFAPVDRVDSIGVAG